MTFTPAIFCGCWTFGPPTCNNSREWICVLFGNHVCSLLVSKIFSKNIAVGFQINAWFTSQSCSFHYVKIVLIVLREVIILPPWSISRVAFSQILIPFANFSFLFFYFLHPISEDPVTFYFFSALFGHSMSLSLSQFVRFVLVTFQQSLSNWQHTRIHAHSSAVIFKKTCKIWVIHRSTEFQRTSLPFALTRFQSLIHKISLVS